MPYRTDTDALRARVDEIERELRDIAAAAQRIDELRKRERTLREELANARSRLRTKTLPVLDDVRIAAPCDARWEDMVGDERVRFCGTCAKNVYNLSAMTRAAAEELIRSREGQLCTRLYRRADGTVITSDCPIGSRRRRRRRLAIAIGGGALVATAAAFASAAAMGRPAPPMMGELRVPDPVPTESAAPTPVPDDALRSR